MRWCKQAYYHWSQSIYVDSHQLRIWPIVLQTKLSGYSEACLLLSQGISYTYWNSDPVPTAVSSTCLLHILGAEPGCGQIWPGYDIAPLGWLTLYHYSITDTSISWAKLLKGPQTGLHVYFSIYSFLQCHMYIHLKIPVGANKSSAHVNSIICVHRWQRIKLHRHGGHCLKIWPHFVLMCQLLIGMWAGAFWRNLL